MSEVNTKIYDHLRCTYKSYKRKDHENVEFKGGYDKGNQGKKMGFVATADPELQEWLEKHPRFKKEFVLRKEVKPTDKTSGAELKPALVIEEVDSASAAKQWMKESKGIIEEHCGVEPTADDWKNTSTIQEFIEKHNIKFPNFISE